MPFNFKQYTASNPLLQEYIPGEEDASIGPSEEKYPRVDFENAVRKALEEGIDRDTLHKIIDWN